MGSNPTSATCVAFSLARNDRSQADTLNDTERYLLMTTAVNVPRSGDIEFPDTTAPAVLL